MLALIFPSFTSCPETKEPRAKGCGRCSHHADCFALSMTLPPHHTFWLMAGSLRTCMVTLEQLGFCCWEGHRTHSFLGCRCDLQLLETDLLPPPDPLSPLCTKGGWEKSVGAVGRGIRCVCTCLSRNILQDFVCGRISLLPSFYTKKAGQFFLAILPTEGRKKIKHTSRLMHSEFRPEVKKPEGSVSNLSRVFYPPQPSKGMVNSPGEL